MKNFTLSVAAALAMSTFAIAGGDIAPVVEPMVEEVAPVVDDSGFYIGGAFSMVTGEGDWAVDGGWDFWETYEYEQNALMLQAGYAFNKYVAIEGRYWIGIGDSEESYAFGDNYDGTWESGSDDFSSDFDAWGIYVKPMYPVTNEFTVYGLLGYADFTIDSEPWEEEFSENGFSWGLGASYAFSDNLSVFVDYVLLYDDDGSEENGAITYSDQVDTWNFGITYNF